MRLFLWLVWLNLIEFLRQPSYVVTSLLFPTLFFSFFALPNIEHAPGAALMVSSFAAFAVLGIGFFQLLVSFSRSWSTSFSRHLRALGIPAWKDSLAKSIAYFGLSAVAAGTVVLCAFFTCDMSHLGPNWTLWIAAVGFGFFPFAATAVLLSRFLSEKNSVPIGNLLYLPLSFAGGLWMPPQVLPEALQEISLWLPTRFYGDLVWSAGVDGVWNTEASVKLLILLVLSSLAFAILPKSLKPVI